MAPLSLLVLIFGYLICIALGGTYNTKAGIVSDKINVHLVPHTHDDVGWLKTVDQYYIGSNNSIQQAGVQYILSSVVSSLEENPDRKFVYVEQAFFQRWWREQNAKVQSIVKELVNSGRLEFINGGWCMHDEATTHYIDMIDQTTLGHSYIKKQFGKTPRIGWQIDPFGHSAVQAYLLGAELGFDGLFFGRIDYQDRAQRYRDRSLEVIWQASKSFDTDSQIFTSIFPVGYGPPDAFQYEEDNEIPVQDDPTLFDLNIEERVNDFVEAAMTQANVTRTNHVMWTMGTDFKYEIANKWFFQMDKLVHYVNKDGRVNALYSTPSLYLDAKYAANESWPLKTEDFFPYADDGQSYWTGYFTSRPAMKRYGRLLSGYLQVARQVEFLVGRKRSGPNTDKLWDALSIVQHHDGVSGTEKQHVANDYAKRLAIGAAEAGVLINSALKSLTGSSNSTEHEFVECPLLNVSYCPSSEATITAGKTLVVTVYNALGWVREEYIRLPVNSENIIVQDATGKSLPSQLANLGVPSGTPPKYWLYFKGVVPPLGFSTFYISASHSNETDAAVVSAVEVQKHNASGTIEPVEVGFSTKLTYSATGEIIRIVNDAAKVELPIRQSYNWYAGYAGAGQDSGAYIFLPNETNSRPVSDVVSLTVIRGPILEEAQQEFAPWVYQASRIFKDKQHTEVESIVGPIPVDDGIGKELITTYSTPIQSNKTFYTDSNGRDFLRRVTDYRSDWKLQVVQPVAGNYYPVNLGIYLRDNNTDFSILVDRAVGGGSLGDGELELMLHRRLLADDSRGVGEPINEVVCLATSCEGLTVQGTLYFSVNSPDKAARWRRTEGQKALSPLHLLFSTQDGSSNTGSRKQTTYSAAAAGYVLPENVAVITLQQLDDGKVLLRLAHIYEVDEDVELSKLTEVDLKKLFGGHKINQAVELSLSANQEKSSMKPRLQWKVQQSANNNGNPSPRGRPLDGKQLIVELGPMEIRTFQICAKLHLRITCNNVHLPRHGDVQPKFEFEFEFETSPPVLLNPRNP